MIVFQVSLNFDPAKEILRIDLYFNKEVDYSEENASDNKGFCSTIREPFKFEPEKKKMCGHESHEKEITQSVIRRYLSKWVFEKISQNSQKKSLC